MRMQACCGYFQLVSIKLSPPGCCHGDKGRREGGEGAICACWLDGGKQRQREAERAAERKMTLLLFQEHLLSVEFGKDI